MSASACCSKPAPGYYQNFTWYPFMWQGGGDFVAERRQDQQDA